MEFRPIRLEDKALFQRYSFKSGTQNCDMSFANIYCWQDTYHSEIAEYGGFLLIRFVYGAGETGYMQPIGEGDVRDVIARLHEDAASRGSALRIVGITQQPWRERIEELFPDRFAFSAPRSLCDYIYLAEDLAALQGSHYKPKRNHINRFRSLYDYRYEPLTAENMGDCMALNRLWQQMRDDHSASEREEQAAMQRAFADFEALGLRGGVLYANGKVAAFTYGSPINPDTFCTHVEKADTDFDGAGAMINMLFAQDLAGEYKYINREEDLGIEGLRFSKLSYRPAVLLCKQSALLLTDRARQIRTLWQEVFGDERDFVDMFLMHHHNPALCFTHEEDGAVVAMLHIIPMQSNAGRVAYIYAVATSAEYRNRGFASALIDEALRHIEQSDNYDIVALIPSDDNARRLYAAHGFADTAIPMHFCHEFDFGTGDTARDVAMVRPLHGTPQPEQITVTA